MVGQIDWAPIAPGEDVRVTSLFQGHAAALLLAACCFDRRHALEFGDGCSGHPRKVTAAWQQATGVPPLADISAPVQAGFIDVVLLAVRGFRGVVTFGMEHRMSIIALRRLEIRGGLLGIALLLGLPAATDAAESVPVLAYVAAKNANPKRLDVFRQGLTELGYVEGKNIKLDYREAVLDGEYHSVMAELVGGKVDIILAANIASAVAAAKATSSIPIVMLAVNDPVGAGLVKSLERPGTNVTGTTMYAPHLIGERLRILQRLVPNLDKVSMILNGNNANNAAQLERVRSEARGLGIEVQALDIRKPGDVDSALDQAAAFGAKALVNAVDSFVNSQRFALAAGAAKHKLPALYTDVEYVSAGGLMALGPGHYEGYHGAAKYVDKILRGANPAELPVAGATQFTFSASRSALAKLGLSLPPDISARVNDWLD